MNDQALAAPEERGATIIEAAAVERIAVHAAGQVDGVEPTGSGLDTVLGHRYPKASAQVAGGRARLQVEVAVAWPHPLADVCAAVREVVTGRLQELTGMRIQAVDVTAATVVAAPDPAPRRVQ